MHYLGSSSCHVILCHIFLMKYICACFLRQLLVITNNILKQLIIPDYYIGVYQKGGSIANGKTSIFVGMTIFFLKKVVPERKNIF